MVYRTGSCNFTPQIQSMKRIMVLLALLFGCLFSEAQTQNTPSNTVTDPFANMLTFKNDDYNFGRIDLGKAVSYIIEITNISKDTVTLVNAHAGCGCTTPNFTPNQKFGPGETVKVTIQFNGSVPGQFTRFTDINFSNGLTKQTRFNGQGIPAGQKN